MGQNKEEMIKQIRELNERLHSLTERIEQLTEQVKTQQPIIINPLPAWPTNNPTQLTQPYSYWWEYAPATTSTTTAKMGDAK